LGAAATPVRSHPKRSETTHSESLWLSRTPEAPRSQTPAGEILPEQRPLADAEAHREPAPPATPCTWVERWRADPRRTSTQSSASIRDRADDGDQGRPVFAASQSSPRTLGLFEDDTRGSIRAQGGWLEDSRKLAHEPVAGEPLHHAAALVVDGTGAAGAIARSLRVERLPVQQHEGPVGEEPDRIVERASRAFSYLAGRRPTFGRRPTGRAYLANRASDKRSQDRR